MSDWVTAQDVIDLWRPLSADEVTRVNKLIPELCNTLRYIATTVGKNIDDMIAASAEYASTAKLVSVDIIGRVLRQSTDGDPMSQESQSALGYSWSGTYAIAGGGIAQAIMKNDLKRLGLKRQKYGVIDFYGQD
jgi:hypothetical protein